MAEQMAGSGSVYDSLKLAYRRGGKGGLLSLFTEKDAIAEHFEKTGIII